MTDPDKHHGPSPSNVSPVLPSSRHPLRRNLYVGRAASAYFDRHGSNSFPAHAHEHHDQVSGIVGAGTVFLRYQTPNGEWHEFIAEGPGYWVVPRGMPHSLHFDGPVEMVTLFMDSTFVNDLLGTTPNEFVHVPLDQLASRDQLIAKHAQLFLRLCRCEDRERPLYIESIGTVLGTHVLQLIYREDIISELRAGLSPERLLKVLRFIDAHMHEKIDLLALATAAGFSEGHFGVLFRRSMGLTPHDYLMRRRLERARELLETTTRKELDIAHSCGFSDDTHMGRRIKKTWGILPKQLRPRHDSGSGPKPPIPGPIPPGDLSL
jgi:AraC family transcriptional regulator